LPPIFNLILLPGVGKIIFGPFLYTVALTAVTKAETLVFWLYAVQKKLFAMQRSVQLKPNIFLLTPRYAA
jgi:hypothetical protein